MAVEIFKIKELKKDLITKRCIDNNLTMEQVANEMGISKSTISRIEKGKIPDVETFGKVVKWLGKEYADYFNK